MVGYTIGLSCLTLFSLLPPSLLPSGPDGWFYHRSVLSYTLLPASAFFPLPSVPDGWFYHRSVLSYTLLPVSAFSPSQAGQMVCSTIGPSCLTLFCLFLPYLSSKAGQMVGSTIGQSCLTLFSLFLPSFPSQAGQMVGSTIGLSCLTLFSLFCLLSLSSRPDGWFYHRSVLSSSLSLFLPYLSSQAGQMVGSTIGPSCLAIFSLLPHFLPSQRPDG
ncbi:hypothetical protein DPMN_004858 [Dreissena polymorpha]|uniref:Cytochrome c biogenesis B n=1 Tax=Dreissena polymorpha TaxID=45954 RepID=A0A9D4RTC4_DREPO|nr:hypothetical protein DPMN_004858 [Dreissena polymorpha]